MNTSKLPQVAGKTRQLGQSPRQLARAGFTLIELVTGMVVVSIAVTIFAQHMRITDIREVELAASDMVRRLDMARSRAIAQRQSVRVLFDTSVDEYRAWVDHDRDGTIDQTDAELDAFTEFRTVDLRQKVTYGLGSAPSLPVDSTGTGAVTFVSDMLDFDSRGVTAPFGTRGTIYIQHKDNPEVVAAVYVSGSASSRMYRFVDGVWQ